MAAQGHQVTGCDLSLLTIFPFGFWLRGFNERLVICLPLRRFIRSSMKKKDNKRYRKEKPWDNENIDHWKIQEWKGNEMVAPLLEESSFATLFPRYREKYLKENWKDIETVLSSKGIKADLNLIEGSMTVSTTRKTKDPYLIVKARELIKLLARSIPKEKAYEILSDEVNCDIIKIGNLVRNKDRFVRRRQRLVGPKGQTLKALEILTKTYIFVQGNTVSCMGTFKGLKQVRRIVVECIRDNYHPIYNIKRLMIIKELEKDEKLKNENWERFLPKFRKVNTSKKRKKGKKKTYTPFPPLPVPSKMDKQIESGEYFLNEIQRKQIKERASTEERIRQKEDRKRKREEIFKPPEE